MLQFERILRAVTNAGGVIGVAAILAMMMLTVVTVVFRAIGIAFPGTYVLAELLLIPAVSFSLAYAAMSWEHTRVELFVDRIRSPRVRHALHGAMTLLGLLFWLAIGWASAREALKRMAQNETSPIINVPVAPFRWMMVAAIALLCVVLVFQAIKLLRGEAPSPEAHSTPGTEP